MKQITAETQIEAIREVSRGVVRTKEAALQFLKDAGIYTKSSSGTPTGAASHATARGRDGKTK